MVYLVEDEVHDVNAKRGDLRHKLVGGGLDLVDCEVGSQGGVGGDADEVHIIEDGLDGIEIKLRLEGRKGCRVQAQVLAGVHQVLHRPR